MSGPTSKDDGSSRLDAPSTSGSERWPPDLSLPDAPAPEDRQVTATKGLAGIIGRFRRMGGTMPIATWSIPFLAILALALLIFVASFWLDVVTSAVDHTEGEVTLHGLVHSILYQDVEQARNTLGGLGEVMAAVLGLALTVSSIIVQLAATRFTPHITSLFFRARTNLMVLGFFVTCNVYVLWVNFSVGHDYLPRWGVLFSMLLMTASLLLLFPYFAYVFDFLDPEKIVGRIMDDGLDAATPTRGRVASALEPRQARAVAGVEHLANIGLNALQQKDKGIASNAVDALCELGIRYGESKAAMRKQWHQIPAWNRQSPDFRQPLGRGRRRSAPARHVARVEDPAAVPDALRRRARADQGHLLPHRDRHARLGEAAGRRGDIQALDLAIKFFNTYLRATLNASDIRTAYNILHQYRQLGEFVLREGASETTSVDPRRSLQHRALQIAKFMRYYSAVSFQRGLTFITEVIAHDIGQLCEQGFHLGSKNHDALLQVFLAVDEHAETIEQEKSLRGVRRAQIKLATTYLSEDREDLARRIRDDMAEEPAERLDSIWNELRTLDTREFWEVNDRGTNFDYLTPVQKEQLSQFFGWFPSLAREREEPPPRKTLSSVRPQ